MTRSCANYPQFDREITTENVVVAVVCSRYIKVGIDFRYCIAIGLVLDDFDVFRDTVDGISMQNPFNGH